MRRPIEERSDARDRGHERDYECGRPERERGHWGEYGVKPLTQNKNATLRRPSRSAPLFKGSRSRVGYKQHVVYVRTDVLFEMC